jgi:hypothetical protein
VRCELRNRLDKIEPSADRALSIMFMRLGVAQIGENTVTHVLGDEAAVALNQFRAAPVIDIDNPPQVLGIQPRRQCRRTHQVAKHHRELAALRRIPFSWLGCNLLRRRERGPVKFRNRPQHLATMTQRNVEVFQILVRQIEEDAGIDVIFRKALSVLGHAELLEPILYLPHRDHRRCRRKPNFLDRQQKILYLCLTDSTSLIRRFYAVISYLR